MLCDRTKEDGAAMWQKTKAGEVSKTPRTHHRLLHGRSGIVKQKEFELREMSNTYAWRRICESKICSCSIFLLCAGWV